jgi:hypothetical protein
VPPSNGLQGPTGAFKDVPEQDSAMAGRFPVRFSALLHFQQHG